MAENIRIPVTELETAVAAVFEASNVSASNARSVAAALVAAEIDGRKGHGLSRISSYAAQAVSGKVDGYAVSVERVIRPSTISIDAGLGFAYPAFDLAIKSLPAVAQSQGIAAAGITRSHHFGVAGHHVEKLANLGLIALVVGNTPKAIAPWGGKNALFGTNPIAFAAPVPNGLSVVIDIAVSQVARGNVMKAAEIGEPIPEGWAFDAKGNPTTDAKAALAGTMAPLGGSKGAVLALMVEILAAALTGANFAYEASSFFEAEGAPPGVGQTLIAIDPGAFGDRETFLARIGAIAGAVEAEPGARLPGATRAARREEALRDGVKVGIATQTLIKNSAR